MEVGYNTSKTHGSGLQYLRKLRQREITLSMSHRRLILPDCLQDGCAVNIWSCEQQNYEDTRRNVYF